jgi:hypothetical protein
LLRHSLIVNGKSPDGSSRGTTNSNTKRFEYPPINSPQNSDEFRETKQMVSIAPSEMLHQLKRMPTNNLNTSADRKRRIETLQNETAPRRSKFKMTKPPIFHSNKFRRVY